MAADPRILVRPVPPEPDPFAGVQLPVWVPCSICWGQRKHYAQDENGRWLVRVCPRCEGDGRMLG